MWLSTCRCMSRKQSDRQQHNSCWQRTQTPNTRRQAKRPNCPDCLLGLVPSSMWSFYSAALPNHIPHPTTATAMTPGSNYGHCHDPPVLSIFWRNAGLQRPARHLDSLLKTGPHFRMPSYQVCFQSHAPLRSPAHCCCTKGSSIMTSLPSLEWPELNKVHRWDI